MIYGVTNREDGTLIQRLTISYKVSIGIPAADGKNYPQKDDHFHIKAKNANGEWIDDNVFTEQLRVINMPEFSLPEGKGKSRQPLREFDAVFLHDSERKDAHGNWIVPESVFKTELAYWATSEKKCSGDGLAAMRSISLLPPAEAAKHKGERYAPWKACGRECPDMKEGRCKPSGRLFFIFKDRPIMGSVAEYSTTSYETISRINSSLIQIMSITGGRLRGIPLKMVIRPGRTSYVDNQGKRKTGHAFFVNIEFRQSDFDQLIPKLLEHSAEYSRTLTEGRRMISAGGEDVVDDDTVDVTVEERPEHEVAKEMTNEFYPENRTETAAGPDNVRPANDDEQMINVKCRDLGLNEAHRQMLYQSVKGDVSEALKWITTFQELADGLSTAQVHEFYSRAILTPNKPIVAWKESKPADRPTRKKKPEAEAPKPPEPPKQPEVPPQAAPQPAHPHPDEPEAAPEPANDFLNF